MRLYSWATQHGRDSDRSSFWSAPGCRSDRPPGNTHKISRDSALKLFYSRDKSKCYIFLQFYNVVIWVTDSSRNLVEAWVVKSWVEIHTLDIFHSVVTEEKGYMCFYLFYLSLNLRIEAVRDLITCCQSAEVLSWTRLQQTTWSLLCTKHFPGSLQTGTCSTDRQHFRIFTLEILNVTHACDCLTAGVTTSHEIGMCLKKAGLTLQSRGNDPQGATWRQDLLSATQAAEKQFSDKRSQEENQPEQKCQTRRTFRTSPDASSTREICVGLSSSRGT